MFEKYLKALGVPDKTISELKKASEDDASKLDIAPLVEEFKQGQRKLMENDEELVSEIAVREQGKILDIVTRKVKSLFSLDAAAIKNKKIDEVLALAKEESTKGLDKSLQDLQTELLAANNKVKEFEEVEIPKIKSEVESEKKAFKISNKLQKLIPVENLRVPNETAEMIINNQLGGSYDIDIDDKGELLLFTKGSKLQAKSSDGTKLLTAQDAIQDILSKNKFIKESNADDLSGAGGGAGGTRNIHTQKPDEKKLEEIAKTRPHLAASMKHAEEIKKNATAAK